MEILQGRFYKYWSHCHVLLQGNLPDPGIEPKSPALQADSLPSESPGNPKNTWVGNLSLLQGIFPTQESNWGLLHCRQILYQLSYQGSPPWARGRANWGLGWEGQVKSTANLLLWQGDMFTRPRVCGEESCASHGWSSGGQRRRLPCSLLAFLFSPGFPLSIRDHWTWAGVKMRK